MSKIFLSYFFKTSLSSFRTAILADDTNRVCRILDTERGYINKEIDSAGNTALLLAIQYASPLTVQLLLKQGARSDQPNFITCQTPLSLLASTAYDTHQVKNALQMATILLDHDAYVDKPSSFHSTDDHGNEYIVNETPLMTAVRTKNLLMATLFVERKANVNYVEKKSNYRPVHYAIMNGDEEMFDLLENAGASCRNVMTSGENTLLHWFCTNKANDEHMSLLKKLIDIGCDMNAENSSQRTPLMLAAKLEMVNTCEMLIKRRADIDKVDYKGYRAIDLAKMTGECYRLLQQVTHIQRKFQSCEHIDRSASKKPVMFHHRLSTRTSEPLVGLTQNETPVQRYPSNTTCQEEEKNNELKVFKSCESFQGQENDAKYKRVWGKLLQKKQKFRQTKHLSLQTINDMI